MRAAELAMRSAAEGIAGVARQAARRLRIGGRAVILAEPAMLRLYALVDRVASSPMPVLVVGETLEGEVGAGGRTLDAAARLSSQARRQQNGARIRNLL